MAVFACLCALFPDLQVLQAHVGDEGRHRW